MQIRSRRLAAISGAALLVGSLMASGAPAVMAQDDYVPPCELPPGQDGQFKVGLANREILNDVNRDIIAGATRAVEAAGGVVSQVTDAGSDSIKHNDDIQTLLNSGVDRHLRPARGGSAARSMAANAAEKGIHFSTSLVGANPEGSLTDVGFDDPLASAMMHARPLLQHRLQGRRLRVLGAWRPVSLRRGRPSWRRSPRTIRRSRCTRSRASTVRCGVSPR